MTTVLRILSKLKLVENWEKRFFDQIFCCFKVEDFDRASLRRALLTTFDSPFENNFRNVLFKNSLLNQLCSGIYKILPLQDRIRCRMGQILAVRVPILQGNRVNRIWCSLEAHVTWSLIMIGGEAIHGDPDYSAVVAILTTDAGNGTYSKIRYWR